MLKSLPSCTGANASPSRREMLRVASCAAAALLSPVGVSFADDESSRKDGKASARCTLGFSTYGMQSLTTERAINTLADIGFDTVELTVRTGSEADSAKLNAKRRQTLRKQLAESPLRLTSLMEHVYPTDDRQQKIALERLKLAAGVSHELSPAAPPLIQTVLGGGNFEKAKKGMVDRLAEWVKVAEETDTIIAIKPHRGGVVSQPAEAVWLFEQLGKPSRLRMVYDYSHYAFRNLPLTETIQTALPYTAHVAVKDAVQQNGRVVFELPGKGGTIDFATIIRQLHAGGYRGDFNCEVSSQVSSKKGYDPIAAAKTSYANIADAFRKAGVDRA